LTETFSPANTNPAALLLHGDGWEINEYNGFNQLIATIVGGVVFFVYTGDPSMIDQGIKAFV